MEIDSTESYAYITGQDKNGGDYSIVAKFSLHDMFFVWFKTFIVQNKPAVAGRAIALLESGSKLAVWHEDQNTQYAQQISVHDTQTGSSLFPFYRYTNTIPLRAYQVDGQFTFDSQGNLWIVQYYNCGSFLNMFNQDYQAITKLIVSDTGITMGYRKFLREGMIGSVYRLPNSSVLFFGGAVAITTSKHLLNLYKLNSATSTLSQASLYQLKLLYYNGWYFQNTNSRGALFITKMIAYYDAQTDAYFLFFITDNRRTDEYGRWGKNVACKSIWTDDTYETMSSVQGVRINYSANIDKVIAAIQPKDQGNVLAGFSRGDWFNKEHVYWQVEFSTNTVNFFYMYPNHEIYAAYLSLTKTDLLLDPTAGLFINTGLVCGATRQYEANEDGQTNMQPRKAGLLTTLRIGDENCGVMSPSWEIQTNVNPDWLQFAFEGGVDTFQPVSQTIYQDPIQTLTSNNFQVRDLDYNLISSYWQACSSYSSISTDVPGSFSDKVVFTDSVDSYPIECLFQRPLVTGGCSEYLMTYTVDQSTLPSPIIHIDSLTQKIVIQQPVGFAEGDYSITVYGYIPISSVNFYRSQFTFNLLIRSSTNPTTCTSVISCSMSTTPVQLSATSLSNQLYYYTFGQGSVTPSFTTSIHTLCSNSDIVYEYSIIPSSSGLDTSFITMQSDGTISWYSEVDQGDSQFFIQIIGKINLTTLGIVKAAQTSFTLVCRSVCASTAVTVENSPIQELFYYTQGDPPRAKKLLLFDGQDGKCLPTYSYKMFNFDTQQQLPTQISQGTLEVGFNPLTRTLMFYAFGTTVNLVRLKLAIFNSYNQLQSTVYYKIEIIENNPPIFSQDISKQTVKVPCQTVSTWSKSLPEIVDAENDPVSLQIEFEEAIEGKILFRKESKQIILNSTAEQPTNGMYTATISLSDSRNATSNYQANFEVNCNPLNQSSASTNQTLSEEELLEEEQLEVSIRKSEKPIPKTKSFTSDGLISFQWNQKMKMLPQTKKFKVEVGRQLQSITTKEEEEALSYLNVDYIQNSDKNWIKPQELDFQFHLSWENPFISTLDIQFEQPEFPSAEVGREDILIITFNDTHAFQGQSGQMVPLNYKLTIMVPRQYSGSHLNDQQIETISQTSKNVARVTVVSSLLLQGVANQLLSLIKNLTVVVHMFILALAYPVETQKFFAALFPMITFDVIPADEWIYGPMWGFDQVQPEGINKQFEDLGYDNILFIMNMGSMFLLQIWTPTYALIVTIAYLTVPMQSIWPFTKIKQAYRNLPNNFFEKLETTYLLVIIMCVVNLMNFNFSTGVWRANTLCALFFFLIYVLTPFHIVLMYVIKIEYNSDVEKFEKANDDFFKTYGALIKPVNVCRVGKYNSIFFIFMKFFYYFIPVSAIFLFIERPVWSIFAFLFNELIATIILLHFNPYWTVKDNTQAFYEKIVLLVAVYSLLMFTQWTNFSAKQLAGRFVVFFIIIQTVLLISIILLYNLKSFYEQVKHKRLLLRKRKIYRQKVQQEQIERQEKKEQQKALRKFKKFQRRQRMEFDQNYMQKDLRNRTNESYSDSDGEGADAFGEIQQILQELKVKQDGVHENISEVKIEKVVLLNQFLMTETETPLQQTKKPQLFKVKTEGVRKELLQAIDPNLVESFETKEPQKLDNSTQLLSNLPRILPQRKLIIDDNQKSIEILEEELFSEVLNKKESPIDLTPLYSPKNQLGKNQRSRNKVFC